MTKRSLMFYLLSVAVVGFAFAAGGVEGPVQKQAVNPLAITMFIIFVVSLELPDLFIHPDMMDCFTL